MRLAQQQRNERAISIGYDTDEEVPARIHDVNGHFVNSNFHNHQCAAGPAPFDGRSVSQFEGRRAGTCDVHKDSCYR